MPLLLGFVAKETLLDAMLHYSGEQTLLIMGVTLVSAVFTAAAGYLLIVDVFWKPARGEVHIHQPPALIGAGTACCWRWGRFASASWSSRSSCRSCGWPCRRPSSYMSSRVSTMFFG